MHFNLESETWKYKSSWFAIGNHKRGFALQSNGRNRLSSWKARTVRPSQTKVCESGNFKGSSHQTLDGNLVPNTISQDSDIWLMHNFRLCGCRSPHGNFRWPWLLGFTVSFVQHGLPKFPQDWSRKHPRATKTVEVGHKLGYYAASKRRVPFFLFKLH